MELAETGIEGTCCGGGRGADFLGSLLGFRLNCFRTLVCASMGL